MSSEQKQTGFLRNAKTLHGNAGKKTRKLKSASFQNHNKCKFTF